MSASAHGDGAMITTKVNGVTDMTIELSESLKRKLTDMTVAAGPTEETRVYRGTLGEVKTITGMRSMTVQYAEKYPEQLQNVKVRVYEETWDEVKRFMTEAQGVLMAFMIGPVQVLPGRMMTLDDREYVDVRCDAVLAPLHADEDEDNEQGNQDSNRQQDNPSPTNLRPARFA